MVGTVMMKKNARRRVRKKDAKRSSKEIMVVTGTKAIKPDHEISTSKRPSSIVLATFKILQQLDNIIFDHHLHLHHHLVMVTANMLAVFPVVSIARHS